MRGDKTVDLLDQLAAEVEAGMDDVDEDRRMFFRGLRHLQEGDLKEASRIFRRAARHCPPPFDLMAKMAQARCEVVRGRQASAVRIFDQIVDSDAPGGLRRLAWMELADLSRERDDPELLQRARSEIQALS